jgi:nucleoside-diphosphate-sugar epimerase
MASIVTWARRHGPAGTFVYTSSTSVYPQGGGVVVDESAATQEAGERGQMLLEAEAQVRLANGGAVPSPRARASAGSGVVEMAGGGTRPPICWDRWFILRLAGIYGPAREHLVDQVRRGVVSGVGSHHLNLIHRDDIVSAIHACFQSPAEVSNEIFNVADDSAATREEISSWLASRLGLESPRFTGLPIEQRRTVTPDRLIGNGKLKRRLGWQPRVPTFREGYAAIVDTAPSG